MQLYLTCLTLQMRVARGWSRWLQSVGKLRELLMVARTKQRNESKYGARRAGGRRLAKDDAHSTPPSLHVGVRSSCADGLRVGV